MKAFSFIAVTLMGLNAFAGSLPKSLEGKSCVGLASNSELSFEFTNQKEAPKGEPLVTLGSQLAKDTYEFKYSVGDATGKLQILDGDLEGRDTLIKVTVKPDDNTIYFICKSAK